MAQRLGLKSCVWAVVALGLLGALLPLGLGWQRLPEPVATHWGIGGAPDGSMAKAWAAAVFAGSILLPAVIVWPHRRRASSRGAPMALATVSFASALMVGVSIGTVWLNWGKSDWTQAGHFPLGGVLLLVSVPLGVALSVFALGRRVWPTPLAGPAQPLSALGLHPAERAYWSGTATNSGMLALGLVLLVEGFVVGLVLSKSHPSLNLTLAVIHGVALVMLELFSKLRVTVDERFITVRYGHLAWLRQRIPIERVLRAEALEIEAMEHGGWGYRGSLTFFGRAAIVIRSGSAVRLDLSGGKRLVISVDDAKTAAELINGFVLRRAPASDGGGREHALAPQGK